VQYMDTLHIIYGQFTYYILRCMTLYILDMETLLLATLSGAGKKGAMSSCKLTHILLLTEYKKTCLLNIE